MSWRGRSLLHNLTMPDGSQRQSKYLRWGRTVAYFLIALSGSLLLLSPIFTDFFGGVATVMSWFLVVGGITSMLGAATGRWVGEFVGLPLLGSSFIVFGLLSLAESFGVTPYIAVANMALLAGFAVVMSVRWRTVLAVFRLASRFSGDDEE